jgi:alkanesulfonate monooxygenase SsuD/methylene tetrahydromethanopterin reductase-like flavin-dependent oxidoreductase (luciferase family)
MLLAFADYAVPGSIAADRDIAFTRDDSGTHAATIARYQLGGMSQHMEIGLTLPNRGVLLGATTPAQMLDLAEAADQSGLFRSVWVGDSLLGKPRMESVSLLAGIAARTRHVRLGPACMASFVLRDPVLLAYQWASLDLLAGGRTVLVGCTGIVEQPGARIEGELYGLSPRDRVSRLIEWIALLKRLWTEDNVTFEGRHYRCTGITVEPKPAAKPRPPIWIANNAREDKPFAEWTPEDFALIERTHRRCARHADGWQTSAWNPKDLEFRINDTLKKVSDQGRDPATFDRHLYHNINVNEDREAALEESQRFLERAGQSLGGYAARGAMCDGEGGTNAWYQR